MNYLVFIFVALMSSVAYGESSTGSDPESRSDIIHFPTKLMLWNIPQGEIQQGRIYLRQKGGDDFTITSIESSSPTVEVLSSERGGEQSRTYVITVQISHEAAPGPFEESLTLHTDQPHQPEIEVAVSGNVLADMVIDPPALSMRLGVASRQATGFVKIASNNEQPFEIKEIRASLPGVTTDLKKMEECCGYYLAVIVDDPQRKIKQPQQAYIRLQTDAEQQVVLIPVVINTPQ